MDSLLKDFRLAFRSLVRAPGFTAVAVLTIALGIGANTAIYSLVDHVLFRPLPFLNEKRLVALWEVAPGGNDHNEFSPADFLDVRASMRTMDHVVAHSWTNANLTGGDRPERVQGFAVTADYFNALEVRPMLGRAFAKGEDVRGSDGVVLLTHGLWARRFGGDSAIVGKTIMMNGRSRQVIGVLPPGVRYPAAAELYVPLAPTPETLASRRAHYLLVTGRLAPGATVEQARAELAAVTKRLAEQYPETNAKWSSNTKMLLPDITRQLQPVMLVLLAAVGFVLLVACANMANLMLARGIARQRELFVCAALGATRGRLVQRVLVESVVITTVGGVLGVALGVLGLRGIIALMPAQHARFVPGFDHIKVDSSVLAVTSLVVIAVALLVSIVPSLRAARSATLETKLKSGGRGGSRHAVRSALVATETGIALTLLVGAGLMVRTLSYLSERSTGLDASRAALTTVALPALRYPNDTVRREFFDKAIAGLRALPGVTAAGATTILPMCQCNSTTSFSIDGAAPFAQGEEPDVGERVITPGYLETLSIPITSGRGFTDADRADAPRVVVVSAALARKYFPGGAIGKRMLLEGRVAHEIIGVAADVRHGGPAAEPTPEFYLAFAQNARSEMTLSVRVAQGAPAEFIAAIRKVVNTIDPELPVFDARTMEEVASLAIGPVRLAVSLLTTLASLALVLAMIGIYGVAAQLVAERTREIGIRMALGSAQTNVVRFIVARGLTAVVIGAGSGIVIAGLLSRSLGSQLVGVPALDPITYVGVTALIFAAAVSAIYLPARRVARIDPMVVLRNEGN